VLLLGLLDLSEDTSEVGLDFLGAKSSPPLVAYSQV